MHTLFSRYNRILFDAETGSGTGSTEAPASDESAAATALAAEVASKEAAAATAKIASETAAQTAADQKAAGEDDTEAKIEAIVQARLQKALDEQVAGLKSKNAELLGTVKDLKTQNQKFTGISDDDLAQMLKTKEALAKDEIARAFAEGRHDEAFERISKPWRDNYEAQIATTTAELEQAKKAAADAQLAVESYKITTEISANVGVVKPAYQTLVTNLIKDQVKTINGTVHVVDASGEIRFNKAGAPMAVAELVETLRPTYGDLFVGSGGGGATGAPAKAPAKSTISAAEAGDLPFEEYVKLRAAGKIK